MSITIAQHFQDTRDTYAPLVIKPALSQYDNYQIYSILWMEQPYLGTVLPMIDLSRKLEDKSFSTSYRKWELSLYASGIIGEISGYSGGVPYYSFRKQVPSPEAASFGLVYNGYSIIGDNYQIIVDGMGRYPRTYYFQQYAQSSTQKSSLIAFQTYSIDPPLINFRDIAIKLKVKPNNVFNHIIKDYDDLVISENIYTLDIAFSTNFINGRYVETAYDSRPFYNQVSSLNLSAPSGTFYYLRTTSKDHYFDLAGFSSPTLYRKTITTEIVKSHIFVNRKDTLQLTVDALITGYSYDSKVKPSTYPAIIPTMSGTLKIHYYRQNTSEELPLYSLDWCTYEVDLIKGVLAKLPIINAVFGTLVFSGDAKIVADVKTKISQLSQPASEYKYSDYFAENIDSLIAGWKTIFKAVSIVNVKPSDSLPFLEKDYREYSGDPILKVIAANNDVWDSGLTYSDENISGTASIAIANDRVNYDRHLKRNLDGSLGDLIMNSPMLEEIHRALNAGKWGVNIDDPTRPRFDNLGWRIERGNQVLGIRVGANGKFDPDKEKQSVKMVISSDTNLEDKEIGITNFAKDGMVLKRINNRFKDGNIVSDECVIVQDFIQLLGEYQDQNNIALGLQESSAIVIAEDDKKAQYHNQLQVLVELLNLANSSNEMLRNLLISSLVTQGQSSEMISALGLPSVTKTIPIKLDGKIADLPYKGVAAHRSISQEIATCTQNVGLVLGQLI
jgi:hypothetical protein